MKTVKTTVYVSDDGVEFGTQLECEMHENAVKREARKKAFSKFERECVLMDIPVPFIDWSCSETRLTLVNLRNKDDYALMKQAYSYWSDEQFDAEPGDDMKFPCTRLVIADEGYACFADNAPATDGDEIDNMRKLLAECLDMLSPGGMRIAKNALIGRRLANS